MDWGLWAFQGSYYVRNDKVQLGVMDDTWHHLRKPNFTDKFQLLQRKNHGKHFELLNGVIAQATSAG